MTTSLLYIGPVPRPVAPLKPPQAARRASKVGRGSFSFAFDNNKWPNAGWRATLTERLLESCRKNDSFSCHDCIHYGVPAGARSGRLAQRTLRPCQVFRQRPASTQYGDSLPSWNRSPATGLDPTLRMPHLGAYRPGQAQRLETSDWVTALGPRPSPLTERGEPFAPLTARCAGSRWLGVDQCLSRPRCVGRTARQASALGRGLRHAGRKHHTVKRPGHVQRVLARLRLAAEVLRFQPASLVESTNHKSCPVHRLIPWFQSSLLRQRVRTCDTPFGAPFWSSGTIGQLDKKSALPQG